MYSLNSAVVTSGGSSDIAAPVRQNVTVRSGYFFEAQEKVCGATIKSFTAYILAQLKCDRQDLAESRRVLSSPHGRLDSSFVD